MQSRYLFALLVVTFGAGCRTAESTTWDSAWSREDVAAGVVLRQQRLQLYDAPQSISVLEIDLDDPGVRLRFADAAGRRPTSAMAEASNAVAAVNGGYFDTDGAAVGLLRIDGMLLFANTQPRQAALGVDAEEQVVIHPGPLTEWPEVPHALSAGPMLVVDGEVDVAPGFAHELVRHPRTAVGLTPTSLLLVTVDGRNAEAAGMTCDELARIMVDLGCHTALNLDGGGSTTMWVRAFPDGGVVNYPSDNRSFDHEGERAVGNAVLVLAIDVGATSPGSPGTGRWLP